jgi:hypothetical protein
MHCGTAGRASAFVAARTLPTRHRAGPALLDDVESLLPEHRERVFPPTETLAMFMAQSLSPHGSRWLSSWLPRLILSGIPCCIGVFHQSIPTPKLGP